MRSIWLVFAMAACKASPAPDEPIIVARDVPSVEPVRLGAITQISPTTASVVTTHRPLLRWRRPEGSATARVDLCRDRDCAHVLAAFESDGGGARPPTPLAPGLVYWRVRALARDGSIQATSHTWTFRVGVEDAPIGTAWTRTLDWNGDGIADLALSRPDGVAILLGGPSGPDATAAALIPRTRGENWRPDELSAAGDLDADGEGELIIGAPSAITMGDAGESYRGGVVLLASRRSPRPLEFARSAAYEVESLGAAVAAGADFDGDGAPDLLIGAPGVVLRWKDTFAQAFVYLGRQHPFVRQATLPTHGRDVSLTAGGDVNGDGYQDAVVGSDAGSRVFLGGADGISMARSLELTSNQIDGTVVIVPDLDHDGYDDIAVAVRSNNRVQLYRGGPSGLSPATPVTLKEPGRAQSWFGSALTVGDFDGDGTSDLAVGASGAHAIYIYSGDSIFDPDSLFGPADIRPRQMVRDGAGKYESPSELVVGDFNGDDIDDLVTIGRDRDSYEPHFRFYAGSATGLSEPSASRGKP